MVWSPVPISSSLPKRKSTYIMKIACSRVSLGLSSLWCLWWLTNCAWTTHGVWLEWLSTSPPVCDFQLSSHPPHMKCLFSVSSWWTPLAKTTPSYKLQAKEKTRLLATVSQEKGYIFFPCSMVGGTGFSEVSVHILWELYLLFPILPFSRPGNSTLEVGGHTACGWQYVHIFSPCG